DALATHRRPVPGPVLDRPWPPKRPRRALDLIALDPADALDGLGRITPASLGTQIERGPAGDRTLDRVDRVFAEEGRLGAVTLVAAERRVVEERALRGRIPCHVALHAALRREIALGQPAPRCPAH